MQAVHPELSHETQNIRYASCSGVVGTNYSLQPLGMKYPKYTLLLMTTLLGK